MMNISEVGGRKLQEYFKGNNRYESESVESRCFFVLFFIAFK